MISFGPTFQDKLLIDHETVSIFYDHQDKVALAEPIFQNCLLMTFGLLHTTLNSLSYSAATAIILYVYVQVVFKLVYKKFLKGMLLCSSQSLL